MMKTVVLWLYLPQTIEFSHCTWQLNTILRVLESVWVLKKIMEHPTSPVEENWETHGNLGNLQMILGKLEHSLT